MTNTEGFKKKYSMQVNELAEAFSVDGAYKKMEHEESACLSHGRNRLLSCNFPNKTGGHAIDVVVVVLYHRQERERWV